MKSAGDTPPVLDLADARCCDPASSGAKAANLARAAVAGLPTLPGFALTTTSFDATDPGWNRRPMPAEVAGALEEAWGRLDGGTGAPLVVRSSSTIEDVGESSMAGQFTSLLDVVGPEAFMEAVATVLGSARSATPGSRPMPMAVLVQRQLDVTVGGVAFGIDPVTGDPRHLLVESVAGGPDQLVSGVTTAQRAVVTRRGRLVELELEPGEQRLLDRRHLAAVARLVGRAGVAFGRIQDIEWAFDREWRLWLLQSRPVTATGELAGAQGPLLGPGPIGETFPEPLGPLAQELWIDPLRDGIERAIALTGVVSRRRLSSSPVVEVVGGRVAADLELFGYTPGTRSAWRVLDPRPGARRLVAAWRIGQVRAALPERVAGVLAAVDTELGAVPTLAGVDDAALVDLVDRCRAELVTVHGHEVLAGTLLAGDDTAPSAAAVALAALAEGRARGLDDAALVAEQPVVLALVPPRLGGTARLPAAPPGPPGSSRGAHTQARIVELGARDALRLRARWLHELSGRAVGELARRLVVRGVMADASMAGALTLDELRALAGGAPAPADLAQRNQAPPGPPLPAAFRRTPSGEVAPVRRRGDHRPGGRGAGGGRGEGPVTHADPEPGDVLVVRTLSPALAVHLPVLAGLVAETGSVLSHLAILAREYHVPTVVAVHDALHRFPVGTDLLVDGDTGDVRVLGSAAGSTDRAGKGSAGQPDDEEAARWAG